MDKREQIARMAQTKEDEILLARVYETTGESPEPPKPEPEQKQYPRRDGVFVQA